MSITGLTSRKIPFSYPRPRHGTTDQPLDVFTHPVSGSICEPCIKTVRHSLFRRLLLPEIGWISWRRVERFISSLPELMFLQHQIAIGCFYIYKILFKCSKWGGLQFITAFNVWRMTATGLTGHVSPLRTENPALTEGKSCFFYGSDFRVKLKRMPSIRETLMEMGVSVEQVLTELAQRSSDEPSNGTVPTPLTNYLDVSHTYYWQVLRGVKQLYWRLEQRRWNDDNWRQIYFFLFLS